MWLNIPIVSWLFLRGRARCCGRPISPRYLIVELLTAIVFVVLFIATKSKQDFIIGSIFSSILIVIAFIDIDTMEIGDGLSIGGMALGILFSVFFPSWYGEEFCYESLIRSLIGACFGSGLMIWIATFGEMAFKKDAVGFGDVKLMGMIGAFLQWEGCVFAVFGGCVICAIVLFPIVILLKILKGKNFKVAAEIPFAPFLVIGSICYIAYGRDLTKILW
jgi:leader peptidase (prepilin peptidase)/N-methyltransferase